MTDLNLSEEAEIDDHVNMKGKKLKSCVVLMETEKERKGLRTGVFPVFRIRIPMSSSCVPDP